MLQSLSIAAFSVLLAAPALAQIEPGDWRISTGITSFAFTRATIEDFDTDTLAFGIAPQAQVLVGRVVSETVELGIVTSVLVADSEDDGLDPILSLGIGPYLAANLALASSPSLVISPFLSLGYAYDRFDLGSTFEVNAFRLIAGAELKKFVAKDASIDLGFFVTYDVGEADFLSQELDAEALTIGPQVSISIWP